MKPSRALCSSQSKGSLRSSDLRDPLDFLSAVRSGGIREEALTIVRFQHEGFGSTLAHEKLTERHDSKLAVETLRHWMIEDGLWVPRARREPRFQQPRRRRPYLGEPFEPLVRPQGAVQGTVPAQSRPEGPGTAVTLAASMVALASSRPAAPSQFRS